ncbi:MAG: RhuM family protein [Bacteroidales bacterium]|nr:RhuM family protein [Bacteroidales bacterium]
MTKETVWLTIRQLALLFNRDRTVIGRHIKNIFSEGELDPSLVCAKFAHTGEYGRAAGYTQTKDVDFYNLDVIISVGYRVKSVRGTRFRQWANAVLKEYLIRGYAINPRLEQLEQRVAKTEEKIDFFVKTALPPVEGIFFDGQIYDAYEFICGLIKSAKTRIILIDNYVDETVLTMLDKREAGVTATIYTQKISSQLQLDITKHNAQYPAIDVKEFTKSHDRFFILDNQVYLIGASLKDLGKKWFAVALMTETAPESFLSRL